MPTEVVFYSDFDPRDLPCDKILPGQKKSLPTPNGDLIEVRCEADDSTTFVNQAPLL